MAYIKDSDLMNYLVYFDQKQTAYFKDYYVPKQEGMSLISDTTVTAIVNHLKDIGEDTGGDSGGTDTIDIKAKLDEYFANKSAALDSGTE